MGVESHPTLFLGLALSPHHGKKTQERAHMRMPGRAQGWTCPLVLHAAINVWFLILDLKSPLPLSIERYPYFPESNAWGFTHNLTGDYELGLSQTQKVIHLQGCCAVQPGHKASRCYPRDTLGPCPPACSSGAPRQNSAMNIR